MARWQQRAWATWPHREAACYRSAGGAGGGEGCSDAQAADEEEARQQAEAEGLSCPVDGKTGYYGVHLINPGLHKPYQAAVSAVATVSLGYFATEEAAPFVARSPEGRRRRRGRRKKPVRRRRWRGGAAAGAGGGCRCSRPQQGGLLWRVLQEHWPSPTRRRWRGGKQVYLGSATAEEARCARSVAAGGGRRRRGAAPQLSEGRARARSMPPGAIVGEDVPAAAVIKEEGAVAHAARRVRRQDRGHRQGRGSSAAGPSRNGGRRSIIFESNTRLVGPPCTYRLT